MVACFLCEMEFGSNLGGQLTNHLEKDHDMSMQDYVIITEYNNDPPKCECGCGSIPFFGRGKFSKYTNGHNTFEWKEKQYIKMFGVPKCETCGKNVKFFRAMPNKYCSFKCHPNQWNQETVRRTVMEKYGVDNVMCIDSVRKKIKNTFLELYGVDSPLKSDVIKNKIKKTNIEKYGVEYPQQNEKVKEKQKSTIMKNHGVSHYSKTKKFRKDSSDRMKENNPMKNKETVIKQTNTFLKNIESGKIKFYETKNFKDTDIHYQGTYEYKFLEYCENRNVIHLIKNSKGFNYLEEDIIISKRHLPDFLFMDNFIIEIKSTYILEKQGGEVVIDSKRRSVENLGYNYILLLDNNFEKFDKILI